MKAIFYFLSITIVIISCTSSDETISDTDSCVEQIWFEDADNDGLGNPDISQMSCEQPEGYVANNNDDIDEVIRDESLIFRPGEQEVYLLNETEANYAFFLYTPRMYDENNDEEYPLIIFLHGVGGRGDGLTPETLNRVSNNGPTSLIKTNQWDPPTPMIVVSPQSPDFWDADRLHTYIKYLIDNLKIDISRIYMTGNSMGGRGTFDYISTYGDNSYPVAVVPIAGWSEINDGIPFRNVALWAFHGDMDASVDVRGSIDMVNAINTAEPKIKARLTIFPESGHGVWPGVYNGRGMGMESQDYDPFDMNIYEWMLMHKKN